jgi:hypothetical protein
MKLLFLKLFLFTIFIYSVSCDHENGKTNQSSFDIQTNTIAEIDTSIFLSQPDTNQFFQKQNLEIETDKKANTCFFQRMEFDFPIIKESLGDTLKIKNVYDWITSFQPEYDETEIRNIIGRGGKYFHLGGNDIFEIIGFLEDEGEYVGVYIYSIDKMTCEILGRAIIAEETFWKNGYNESFAIIETDFTLKKIKRVGTKDWGDYTKWKKDATITLIKFELNGKIFLENYIQ